MWPLWHIFEQIIRRKSVIYKNPTPNCSNLTDFFSFGPKNRFCGMQIVYDWSFLYYTNFIYSPVPNNLEGATSCFGVFEDKISIIKGIFHPLHNIICSETYFFLPQLIKVCTLRHCLPPTLTSIKNLQKYFAQKVDPTNLL